MKAISEGTAGGTYEFPDAVLEHSLRNAYDTMALVLKAAGLTGTRAQLLKKRADFEKKVAWMASNKSRRMLGSAQRSPIRVFRAGFVAS